MISTSIGDFSREEFISRCNDHSFPEGLKVHGDLEMNKKARDFCTSMGVFTEEEFIKRCNEGSFPEDLVLKDSLSLRKSESLTALPEGLRVRGWVHLGCTSLTTLPKGLQVGGGLNLRGCDSITALPSGLQVRGTIYVDKSFLENYPFRDIPKILHLPFEDDKKQILLDRLKK